MLQLSKHVNSLFYPIGKKGAGEMMNYEKPLVLANEDVAEGVYAASGAICWTTGAVSTQDYVDGNHIFEISAQHTTMVEHISNALTVELSFNYPITSAYSENDWTCSVNGSKVTVTRPSHANAYKSGDSVTFKVWVGTGDEATTKALTCSATPVNCDMAVNVQGNGADEFPQ